MNRPVIIVLFDWLQFAFLGKPNEILRFDLLRNHSSLQWSVLQSGVPGIALLARVLYTFALPLLTC